MRTGKLLWKSWYEQQSQKTDCVEAEYKRNSVDWNCYRKNKETKLHNAVYGNLKLMKRTLTDEQYAKYTALLNITLKNKGIELSK